MNNTIRPSLFRLHQLETVSEWIGYVYALAAGQQVIIDHLYTGCTVMPDQGPKIPDEKGRMRLARWTKVHVDSEVNFHAAPLEPDPPRFASAAGFGTSGISRI